MKREPIRWEAVQSASLPMQVAYFQRELFRDGAIDDIANAAAVDILASGREHAIETVLLLDKVSASTRLWEDSDALCAQLALIDKFAALIGLPDDWESAAVQGDVPAQFVRGLQEAARLAPLLRRLCRAASRREALGARLVLRRATARLTAALSRPNSVAHQQPSQFARRRGACRLGHQLVSVLVTPIVALAPPRHMSRLIIERAGHALRAPIGSALAG